MSAKIILGDNGGILTLPQCVVPACYSVTVISQQNRVSCAGWDFDVWHAAPASKSGMWHCPSKLLPWATAWPSLRRCTVWYPPADTWRYDIRDSKVECCIVHTDSLHTQLHSHHFEEPQYETTPLLRPYIPEVAVDFHTGHVRCIRKKQHNRRFIEAPKVSSTKNCL
jgi:hypothetical protein